jgi:hypothetical protein
MLAFLPIIGPIIQGIASIFGKWQDTKLGTLKVQRESDVAESQVSEQIIHDTQDDIGLRLMRDLVCFPIVVWIFLVTWDTILAENTWVNHDWMWHTAGFDKTSAPYLPYAVITFLLGNIGINMWNRK